jgi:hypothetical protein
MTIQTIDELLDFIETNYERLSDKAYVDICRSTMHLYEYKKLDTKEATLKRIKELNNFANSYSSIHELPLFMEENL